MAANTAAIFPVIGNMAWATLTTQNTALDGTGTVSTIFTSASNGSRLDTIKVRPLGTNVATVLRIFINNGSTNATAANNTLYYEQTMPATSALTNAAQTDTEIPMDLVLPVGYKINVTVGTTIAAGIAVCAVGGNY